MFLHILLLFFAHSLANRYFKISFDFQFRIYKVVVCVAAFFFSLFTYSSLNGSILLKAVSSSSPSKVTKSHSKHMNMSVRVAVVAYPVPCCIYATLLPAVHPPLRPIIISFGFAGFFFTLRLAGDYV